MKTELVYFGLTLATLVGVLAAVLVVAWSDRGHDAPAVSVRRWLPLGAAVAALLIVGLMLKVGWIAERDASIVAELASGRSAGLDDLVSLITRMGDVVFSYLVAGALTIGLALGGRRPVSALVLPLVVVVELAIQFLLADHLLVGFTVDEIRPNVPVGGAGSHPSGATARLFALFLVAAMMCRSTNPRAARALLVTGTVATFVEIVTRLYLGRHLVLDIIGGLLLGAALVIVATAVATWSHPADRRLSEHFL